MTAFWSFLWPLQAFRDVHAPVAQPRLFRPEYVLMDRDSGMKMMRTKRKRRKKNIIKFCKQFDEIVMNLSVCIFLW